LQLNAFNGGRSLANPQTAEGNTLQELATGEDLTASQAQGILNYFYKGNYQPIPILPEPSLNIQQRISTSSKPDNAQSFKLFVSPNPAKEWVTIEWNLSEGINEGILIINDLYGKTVFSKTVDINIGQIVWDTRLVENGVYVATLSAKNGEKATSKITITH